MNKEKLPKRFTCECGKFHEFSVWVYAHWDNVVWNRCECGRQNTIQCGKVVSSEKVDL